MKRAHAFSLIELTIVLAVLAVLAALVLPRFADATEDAAITAAQTNLAIVERQVEKYHGMHGEYPNDIHAGWFVGGELPANPLIDFDTPTVVEVETSNAADQTEPATKMMDSPSTSPWWYSPETGQVRLRVVSQGSTVETLRLYNLINSVNAANLADVTAARVRATE